MELLCVGCFFTVLVFLGVAGVAAEKESLSERKLLYVATPGVRDYLEYGGHGILIFNIENGHRFVKRLPSAGLNEKGKPMKYSIVAKNGYNAPREVE